jgi:uncharacterized protein YceH (UPF0502 family)
MEFDPETNTYTSHGPKARAEDNEREVKKLRKEVADLKSRIADLEDELESR